MLAIGKSEKANAGHHPPECRPLSRDWRARKRVPSWAAGARVLKAIVVAAPCVASQTLRRTPHAVLSAKVGA